MWVQGVKKALNGDGALHPVMKQKIFIADETTGTKIDTDIKELLL